MPYNSLDDLNKLCPYLKIYRPLRNDGRNPYKISLDKAELIEEDFQYCKGKLCMKFVNGKCEA